MSPSSVFPLGTCGMLAFLVTAAIGWNLSSPPPMPLGKNPSAELQTKHGDRRERTTLSLAAEAASKRMGSIRAAADPEARMLATLSLAHSLDPADFAAWVDGGWFNLRGGPELMMFTKVLMDRWEAEDPEGLLAWAAKNKSGEGIGIMKRWADKEPQRLLAWFQKHRDDETEVRMLGLIAKQSPELAIQRLREMVQVGMAENAIRNARGLMNILSLKSPAALEGLIASLPPDLKIQAESVLSKKRLEASFSEEIRSLWDRPDGWRIFSSMENSPETWKKLMGELGNLPEEWRRLMASNSYQFVRHDAKAWLTMDLDAVGFSPSEIRSVRTQALQNVAYSDPALAIGQLAEGEIEPGMRKHILESIFRSGNQPNLRELAAQLPEEDRKLADELLAGRDGIRVLGVSEDSTPQEMLEKIVTMDTGRVGTDTNFPIPQSWDRAKIEALAKGFSALPADQKTKAANLITGNAEYNTAPPGLKGAALRYLAEQPDAASDGQGMGFESLTAKISNHAVTVAEEDPAEAASWVGSLPPGEARTWAQKNVLKNWSQYDPDAAAAWKKSFSVADRDALGKLGPR